MKALVSFVLIAIVIWKARGSLDRVGQAASSLDLLNVVTGVAAFLLLVFIKAVRWQWLVRKRGYCLPLRHSFLAYLGGIALGAVTPGRLGEFARVYNARQQTGMPLRTGLVSVLSDRCFDLFALLACALAGGLLLVAPRLAAFLPLAFALIVAVGLTSILALAPALLAFASRAKGRRFSMILFVVADVAQQLGGKRPAPWLQTAAAYAIYFLTSYGVVRVAGIEIGFLQTCAVISVVGLVVLLPISVAGLGTREVVFVTMMARMGVDEGLALAASLLHFGLFFVAGSVLGAFAMLFLPMGFSKHGREVAERLGCDEDSPHAERTSTRAKGLGAT